jgi:hypothetical protein
MVVDVVGMELIDDCMQPLLSLEHKAVKPLQPILDGSTGRRFG